MDPNWVAMPNVVGTGRTTPYAKMENTEKLTKALLSS